MHHAKGGIHVARAVFNHSALDPMLAARVMVEVTMTAGQDGVGSCSDDGGNKNKCAGDLIRNPQ